MWFIMWFYLHHHYHIFLLALTLFFPPCAFRPLNHQNWILNVSHMNSIWTHIQKYRQTYVIVSLFNHFTIALFHPYSRRMVNTVTYRMKQPGLGRCFFFLFVEVLCSLYNMCLVQKDGLTVWRLHSLCMCTCLKGKIRLYEQWWLLPCITETWNWSRIHDIQVPAGYDHLYLHMLVNQ